MTKHKSEQGSVRAQVDAAACRRTDSGTHRLGGAEPAAPCGAEIGEHKKEAVGISPNKHQTAVLPDAGTVSAPIVDGGSVIDRKKSSTADELLVERSRDAARTLDTPDTTPRQARKVCGGTDAMKPESRDGKLELASATHEIAAARAGVFDQNHELSTLARAGGNEDTARVPEEALSANGASTAPSATNAAHEESERKCTTSAPSLAAGAVTRAISGPESHGEIEKVSTEDSKDAVADAAARLRVSREKEVALGEALGMDAAQDRSSAHLPAHGKGPPSEEHVRAGDDGESEGNHDTEKDPPVVIAVEPSTTGPRSGDGELEAAAGKVSSVPHDESEHAVGKQSGQSTLKVKAVSAAIGPGEQTTPSQSDTAVAPLSETQLNIPSKAASVDDTALEVQEHEGGALERQSSRTDLEQVEHPSTIGDTINVSTSSGMKMEKPSIPSQAVSGQAEGMVNPFLGSVQVSMGGSHSTQPSFIDVLPNAPGRHTSRIGPSAPEETAVNADGRKSTPVNVEASTKLEDLRRDARKLGEAEYMRGPGAKRPRPDAGADGRGQDPVMLKKDKKSQSAYVSRFAAKEYEKLLEQAVQAADALLSADRNRNAAIRQDNADMREQVTALENIVRSGLATIRGRLGAPVRSDTDGKDSKVGVVRSAPGLAEAGERPVKDGDEDAVMREPMPDPPVKVGDVAAGGSRENRALGPTPSKGDEGAEAKGSNETKEAGADGAEVRKDDVGATGIGAYL
jgi:hypothetical protein